MPSRVFVFYPTDNLYKIRSYISNFTRIADSKPGISIRTQFAACYPYIIITCKSHHSTIRGSCIGSDIHTFIIADKAICSTLGKASPTSADAIRSSHIIVYRNHEQYRCIHSFISLLKSVCFQICALNVRHILMFCD